MWSHCFACNAEDRIGKLLAFQPQNNGKEVAQAVAAATLLGTECLSEHQNCSLQICNQGPRELDTGQSEARNNIVPFPIPLRVKTLPKELMRRKREEGRH